MALMRSGVRAPSAPPTLPTPQRHSSESRNPQRRNVPLGHWTHPLAPLLDPMGLKSSLNDPLKTLVSQANLVQDRNRAWPSRWSVPSSRSKPTVSPKPGLSSSLLFFLDGMTP